MAWRRFRGGGFLAGASFCGLLKMVTFDGDVGIVFVEAYNYLSDLSILVRIICRNWIFWCKLFVGFEYFSAIFLSDLDILV